MAARTINIATLKSGNSISTIDKAIIESPNAIFAILEDLYLFKRVVIFVVSAVAVTAVGLTTPNEILSIPITNKTSDNRSTVVEIEEPGINKITAASKTEIEPNTI